METVHDGPLTVDELNELADCIRDAKPWRGYIVTFIEAVTIVAGGIIGGITVKGIKCDN